jgi:hypothetical protein
VIRQNHLRAAIDEIVADLEGVSAWENFTAFKPLDFEG